MSAPVDRDRLRAIVKRAAAMTRVAALRQWVGDDPEGAFERDAGIYLARVRPEIAATMSVDAVDEAIANEVILSAAQAMRAQGPRRRAPRSRRTKRNS